MFKLFLSEAKSILYFNLRSAAGHNGRFCLFPPPAVSAEQEPTQPPRSQDEHCRLLLHSYARTVFGIARTLLKAHFWSATTAGAWRKCRAVPLRKLMEEEYVTPDSALFCLMVHPLPAFILTTNATADDRKLCLKTGLASSKRNLDFYNSVTGFHPRLSVNVSGWNVVFCSAAMLSKSGRCSNFTVNKFPFPT